MDPSNVAASCQFYRCSQVIDWIAGATKAVNDNKAAQRQLELKRHNRIMKGRSYYLASYKRGQGIACKKKKRSTLKMPRGVTHVQLQQLANCMRIPYFKGIFMRTTLSTKDVRQNEIYIVNLDMPKDPICIGHAKRRKSCILIISAIYNR